MLYYKHDSSGEIKAEYAYNAWGEVISSTGTMAEINPIRYRGYYYDAETGFYYCKSRYYDPEICRFISPDSSYSTGQDFAGTNMFVYCGNNPVSREDTDGDFWGAIGIGFVCGLAGQYVSDVIENISRGESGLDIFKSSSSVADYLSSGLGGAIAAVPGLGLIGTMATGSIGNIVSEGFKGNIRSWRDFGKSALNGAVANGLGYGASKLASACKVTQINNMTRSNRKIYLRDNLFVNSQAMTNQNLKLYSNNTFGGKMNLVEGKLGIFRAGIYSTITSSIALLF